MGWWAHMSVVRETEMNVDWDCGLEDPYAWVLWTGKTRVKPSGSHSGGTGVRGLCARSASTRRGCSWAGECAIISRDQAKLAYE